MAAAGADNHHAQSGDVLEGNAGGAVERKAENDKAVTGFVDDAVETFDAVDGDQERALGDQDAVEKKHDV